MNTFGWFRPLTVAVILAISASLCAAPTQATPPFTSSPSVPQPASPVPVERQSPSANTYYVRPDGGSYEQCSGLADAPYNSGTGQACAWNHPFQALRPPNGAARIQGGDTLLIKSGSYKMGYGAPGSEACEAGGSFDCTMPPIPSGPDSTHPTRILGEGWNTGCAQPPELWGSERPWYILNLSGSNNVEVACLNITDHSSCVEAHTGGLACNRDTSPYGDWASVGLFAQDSANVRLADLNIHGLASGGVHAGRLKDWAVQRVRIAGNGLSGWDGDLADPGGSSNSGTMSFSRLVIEWNGCGETWPGGQPTGCWGQTAGGYGDGLGTAETGGNWVFEDSAFLHNTSDGLDLLYHTLGGTTTINRVRSEGNAGNPIKIAGPATITNSVLVANCGFFDGQPFTFNVDPCRALGNTLLLAFTGGETVSIVNSSFYGQGDGLIGAGPRDGFTCNGSERIYGTNNLFMGATDYFDSTDITFLFYQENCGSLVLDNDYGIAYNVKNTETGFVNPPFGSGHNLLQDPQLGGPLSGNSYGMWLKPGSPAIDAGLAAACPTVDYAGRLRPADGNGDGTAVCDLGAYEYQPPAAFVFLPLIIKIPGSKAESNIYRP